MTTNLNPEGQQALTDLLPCPFCGGEAKLAAHPGAGRGMYHRGDTVYSIDCMGCAASACNRYREDVIVAAWNRRAGAATRPPERAEPVARDEKRLDYLESARRIQSGGDMRDFYVWGLWGEVGETVRDAIDRFMKAQAS